MRRLRKFRLRAFQKTSEKIKIDVDGVLIAGVVMMIFGGVFCALNYAYYTSGRPEGVSNSRYGTRYHQEIPPGYPMFRDIAVLCAAITGFGVILSVSALIWKALKKFGNLEKEKSLPPFSQNL